MRLLSITPEIVQNRYRTLFNSKRNTINLSGRQETLLEATSDSAEEEVLVRNYQEVPEARIKVIADSCPLQENGRGRTLSMTAFVIEPTGHFRQQGPVAYLTG